MVGSIITLFLAWLLTGNPLIGIEIGVIEILTKMVLYYIHEKLWYKVNYGLNTRDSSY
jgi:uncharacterized membrane protein